MDDTSGEFEEIDDGETVWRFETGFLTSNWTCVWGQGCLGILPEPAPARQEGCCSIGADLGDEAEAMMISAMAAMLEPAQFQHHADAADVAAGGIFRDDERLHTRVIDGACIFFNRPGFAGGVGCALHLAAVAAEESPLDWKPSVCWQLPIKVDWAPTLDGRETATVRRWSRTDWGEDGATMAWCCTEGERAYVGDRPVLASLAEELEGMAGTEVFVELRRRLA